MQNVATMSHNLFFGSIAVEMKCTNKGMQRWTTQGRNTALSLLKVKDLSSYHMEHTSCCNNACLVCVHDWKSSNQILLSAITVVFFPIIVWLADDKVGRYTIMKASLPSFFPSNIMLVIHSLGANLIINIISDILLYAGSITLSFALSCCTSSFLQFVTDQQLETSGRIILHLLLHLREYCFCGTDCTLY